MVAGGRRTLRFVDNWLCNIKDVYNKYQMELETINDLDKRIDRLTEFSVIEQVRNLAKTTIIQEAWKKRPVVLHGWVYGINSGIITELNVIDKNNKDLEPIYRFDI